MGGKRMTQKMRLYRFGDPGPAGLLFHDTPKTYPRKTPSPMVQKQMAHRLLPHKLRTAGDKPGLEGQAGLVPDRNHPLLRALAENPHKAVVQVDLLKPKIGKFGYPEAARIKKF